MSLEPQKTMFDDEPVPWDEDDAAEQLVATVVFAQGPPQEFDYHVPDKLRGQVEAGRRVRVPLGRGNRPEVGYCVRLENRRGTSRRLKDVRIFVDPPWMALASRGMSARRAGRCCLARQEFRFGCRER